MHSEEVRRIVGDEFYHSLSTSGFQITSVPPDQLRAIVNALADSMFAVFDALEEEGMAKDVSLNPEMRVRAAANPAGTVEEQLLWQGRPYLTIGTRYELTSQRLRVVRGILGKTVEEIELVRVKDTKVKQHMGERMFNIGDITVLSADPSTPELVLNNVKQPLEVRELIRKTVMTEKERHGLYYREDLGDEGPQHGA